MWHTGFEGNVALFQQSFQWLNGGVIFNVDIREVNQSLANGDAFPGWRKGDFVTVVADNVKNITYSKILIDIKQKIFQGQLFSEAMAEYPEYFPAATITYIKIGEKTGQIEENLQSAVAYMEIKCSTLTDRIKQIAQPALVLIAGACITLLLITVMPIINAATNFGGI